MSGGRDPDPQTVAALRDRLDAVRARIAGAAAEVGRDPRSVRIVGVTKEAGLDQVRAAAAVGLTDLAENRAQDLDARATRPGLTPAEVRWHFVGRLQRNKVARLARHVAWWHSVDRPELAPLLGRHAPGARVLVQVNVAAEPGKGGCPPAATAALVELLVAEGCRVEGLMTVPPRDVDPAPHFAALAGLAAELGLAELSMGMSADLEAAVAQGATVVRVGRSLFGPRPTTTGARR